jgi:integrase
MAFKAPLYKAGQARVTTKGTRFRVVWTEHGRQRELSADTLDAAVTICDEQARRLAGGQADHRTATVSDAVHGFLQAGLAGEFDREWSEVTHDQLESLLNCHLTSDEGAGLGSTLCSSLTRADTKTAMSVISEAGYSPVTVKAFSKACRRVVAFGLDIGIWTPEVARQLRLGLRVPDSVELEAIAATASGTAQVTDIPTASEVSAFIGSLRNLHGPYGTLAELTATTGLRWGESVSLRWSDVELDLGTVSVRRARKRKRNGTWIGLPKTRSSVRTVGLTGQVIDQLKALPRSDDDPSAWVFTTTRGEPITSASGFRRSWWSKAAAASGYRHTWHTLRHFYASQQIANGVPLTHLSRSLGHASVRITADVYLGAAAAEALQTSVYKGDSLS